MTAVSGSYLGRELSRILKLPDEVRMVASGRCVGHARALLAPGAEADVPRVARDVSPAACRYAIRGAGRKARRGRGAKAPEASTDVRHARRRTDARLLRNPRAHRASGFATPH